MPLQDNTTERRGFRRRIANRWAFAVTDAVSSLIAYGTKAITEPRRPGPDRIALAVAILLMASCDSKEEVGFISGSPEDKKSIREIIDKNEPDHYTKDVDWENAFGGRFLGREAVNDFVETTVRPTLKDVQSSSRITVRFLGKDLALVKIYWPNQRQIFKVDSGRVMGYKVMEDKTELGSAKRVGQ